MSSGGAGRGGRTMGGLWLALLAFAGLLGGHSISFFLVAPHEHDRETLLRSTGHNLDDLFGPAAVAALVAGIIAYVAHQLRSGSAAGRGGRGRAVTALMLWVLQTLGFVLLEAGERMLASHPIADLAHEPAFLVGLVAQLVVALAGALLVDALRRTVAAVRALLGYRPATSPLAVDHVVKPFTPRSFSRHYSWSLRGPPLS